MTFCQISIFHDFFRPGFYFFIFHGFPWFSMTVVTLYHHSLYAVIYTDTVTYHPVIVENTINTKQTQNIYPMLFPKKTLKWVV